MSSLRSLALVALGVTLSAARANDARAEGFLDAVDCASGMTGWAAAPGDKETAIDVAFTFDGAATDPGVVLHPYVANLARQDLCADHGCDHGFVVTLPLSLYDGAEHTVHAYGAETGMGSGPELADSPKTFTCPLVLPAGVKREIADDASMGAWRFSPFWDEISVSDGILASYTDGAPLPAMPDLVHTAMLPDDVLLLDVTADKKKVKRAFQSPVALLAWDISAPFTAVIDDAALAKIPSAVDVRARPFVLRGAGGALFLVDDDPKVPPTTSGTASTGSMGAGGAPADDGATDGGCQCDLAADARTERGVAAIVFVLGLVGGVARRRPRLTRA